MSIVRLIVPFFVLWFVCQGLQASTGYFPDGWGAATKGYAGSGSALAEEPLSMANNPAGLVALKGRQIQFDTLFLRASADYTAGPLNADPATAGPGAFPLKPGRERTSPDNIPADTFIIPQMALSWRLTRHSAVGLAIYANGGLNTTYDTFDNPICPPGTAGTGVFCGGGAGIDISQTFIAPTYAHQFGNWLRIGISPILAIEAFEARGLSAFAPTSQNSDALTNKGHDYSLGYGLKLGSQIRPLPWMSVGLVYQTKVRVDPFEDYEGLLPDSGRLDIPALAQIGLAFDLNRRWTWMLDVRRVYFSRVSAQGNSPDAAGLLGTSGGPGFGWGNGTSYSTGVRYKTAGKWVWRAGYRYSKTPVDSDQLFLNVLAQSVLKHHVAVGGHFAWSQKIGLDFSLLHSLKNEESGQNPQFPEQRIDVSLSDVELDLSFRYRF